MLPSRGLSRASPALGLKRSLLSQPLHRYGPSAASKAGSSRQFGTTLRSNGKILNRSLQLGALSGGGLGAAGILSSRVLSSAKQARYASTQPTPTPSPPADAAAPTALPDLSSSPIDIDGSSLLNMPEQVGYLQALGLDFGWGPTSTMQWLLEHIHVYTGLPWWASIAATAVLIRLAIFKPSLTAAEHSQKMQKLRQDPVFAAAQEKMMASMQGGGKQGMAEMQRARQDMKLMQEEAGFKMWRTLVPLVNVPIGFGMFRLLRAMAALPVPGLETGGFLWFSDMTLPDPFFIMPVASAGIMFLIMRSNLPYMAPQQAAVMKMMQYVLTPLSIAVTFKMAASLQFFFVMSAVLQWCQTWLFFQPWLRRWANLPPMESHAIKVARAASQSGAPGSGGQWQAPRTISTTARPAETVGDDRSVVTNNPMTNLKNAWKGVMGETNKRQASRTAKAHAQKAEEYEKKRQLEEQEKYYKRKEERIQKARGRHNL